MSEESKMLGFYSSPLCDRFRQLSAILEQTFGLDGFFYSYFTPDGYFYQIGNRPDVGETYFSNKCYMHNPLICHPDNYVHDQAVITDDLNHDPFHSAQKTIEESYGFKNFLCIPKKENGCLHLVMFSSSDSHLPLNSIFLQNRYALSSFGDYFFDVWKEQAGKMENYTMNMGELLGQRYYQKNPELSYGAPKGLIDRFGKEIGLVDQFAKIEKLSKRERDCVELFLKGMTASQIGDELGISKRTVYDYLDHVK